MNFEDISKIENEAEQVNAIYEVFDEDSRLASKASRVEFLTSVRAIESCLRPGDRILDIGAGAGEYSLHFARKGYEVCAVELADANIAAFKKKIKAEDKLYLRQGNALDLSFYPDGSFDVVLLFGPLYHLHAEADRQRAIAEARRVCRPGGKIFFAFITNDFVILTELMYNSRYFTEGDYDKASFRLHDFPFVFATPERAREMLRRGGVKILREIAADGVSELLADKINEMSDEDYEQYLRYHFYISEKPEMLGMTNHLLIVGEN